MTDRFDICWPYTLIQECPLPGDWTNSRNYSFSAHDPGGATMCGIIQREYDIYRKSKGLPTQAVRLISKAEGQEIYTNSYWLPDCPKLPWGLDLCVFDESVNAGPFEAIRLLQGTLGIPADGVWGPQTGAAVAGLSTVTDPASIIDNYTARREAFYRALSGFKYFGTDWIRRAQEIGAEALKMAAA